MKITKQGAIPGQHTLVGLWVGECYACHTAIEADGGELQTHVTDTNIGFHYCPTCMRLILLQSKAAVDGEIRRNLRMRLVMKATLLLAFGVAITSIGAAIWQVTR